MLQWTASVDECQSLWTCLTLFFVLSDMKACEVISSAIQMAGQSNRQVSNNIEKLINRELSSVAQARLRMSRTLLSSKRFIQVFELERYCCIGNLICGEFSWTICVSTIELLSALPIYFFRFLPIFYTDESKLLLFHHMSFAVRLNEEVKHCRSVWPVSAFDT